MASLPSNQPESSSIAGGQMVDAGEEHALPQLADGHIDLLRAYFGCQAFIGVLLLSLVPFHWLFGPFLTIGGNPWITLPLAAVSTWAAFRTRRLLLDHDREGALMAAGAFACNLAIAWDVGHVGIGAILSGLGIPLAANVYVALWRAYRPSLTRPQPNEEL